MPEFSRDKTYALFRSPLNKRTISELSVRKIEMIIFPQIITTELENTGSFSLLPDEFDWLVFPDVYAVEYFVGALEKAGIDLFELDAVRVLAYGEAVSDRLRFSQIHADVIPPTVKTPDVLRALKDYIFGDDDFEQLRFLILHEKTAEIELAGELRELGAAVTNFPVYSAIISDPAEIPRLKALLKGGAIDEFIFSSYTDVLNLAQMFQTENLTELLEGITLTAADNATRQSLLEFRLREK
jgi:uroporphyrinogen-III synthase